ncbi:MAG: hypothetical protein JRN11_05945 [Nitrososphaerota archaeon]|nr:hypothetical protein [Nitrososphaerota archaeon]MDG7026272.1 hypothetical protein [Nitrososphaerota archaeon]
MLCFEVKPSSLYAKADYMRLLVNSSVLNAYAEGMSNVSNKMGAGGAERGYRAAALQDNRQVRAPEHIPEGA